MCWSETGKNGLESTEKLIPFPRNWNESTKYVGLPERDEDCYESGKNMNVISVMSPKNRDESCKDVSWFGKSESSVEEEVRAKGISDEHRDLLIKGGGALAPGIEKTDSWVEMAKDGFEKSKSWAEEKIRAMGISDERRDLVVKAGGTLLLAAAVGYYSGLGGACGYIFGGGSSKDDEKLMKAPGRPGEFIARAAFEANPGDYFRRLRGKHP